MYEIIIGRGKEAREKLGTKGSVLLGRHYVKMGQTISLSSEIFLDVNTTHVVFICGKRGSGKCLHGDTLITLENGSQIPIKDLKDNKERVLSLNDSLKIEKAVKSDFFSREVDKLLKIKLRSGKEIKLTPEHPLLTIKGWKEAQSLTIGSRIATPRRLDSFGEKTMPDHVIKLLSYLIAEGHTKKVVLFSNSDNKIVEDFRKALKEFDPSLELIKEKKYHYRISSPKWKPHIIEHNHERNEKGWFIKGNKNKVEKRSIRKLIEKEEIFGLNSKDKFLSNNLMQLKKEDLALFLNRLFSCDGSIYRKNDYWEVCYGSSSKRMIKQIQNLLLRFDILSKLRDKKVRIDKKVFKSYELVINAANSLKFIEQIGFFGEKEVKQRIALEEIKAKIRNPNIDTIPKDIWQFFKPKSWARIGRELGYKYPKAMRERIYYCPSRQMLLQIAKVENNNPWALIAQSDIFWDEIVSMEILDGKFTVYDLSVPKNHNFVANDIIVHNSYTMGTIAEGIASLPAEVSQNICTVIFDTMGIYWTMKYPNHQDIALLEEWKLKPSPLDIKIYTPFGYFEQYKKKGIPTDYPFSLKPAELTSSDWCMLFDIDKNSEAGVLIERTVHTLSKEKGDSFSISDIIAAVQNDARSEKNTKELVENQFSKTKTWGLFSSKSTPIDEMSYGGRTIVLDLSCYAASSETWEIRALVIGIISKKLFIERMTARKTEEYAAVQKQERYFTKEETSIKRKTPLIWLMLDEAHEFLRKKGKTTATDALITILREGREPGISLVLASQQPGKIHTDVMTQSDVVISHRLTAKIDTEALAALMQSYMRQSLDAEIDTLPRVSGAALVFDDMNEKLYPVQIRPRLTWHGGAAPTAIQETKKEFGF